MKTYEKQLFESGRLPPGFRIDGVECIRCDFNGCSTNGMTLPNGRALFTNIILRRCAVRGGTISGAIFEDVLIEDLKTHGLHQQWGCAYKHVMLRGKIGRLMTSPLIDVTDQTSARQRGMDESNGTFYKNVDWALDITEAHFQEADLRGIPARLVRRDPGTQVVITRERVQERERWESIKGLDGVWSIALDNFLRSGSPDKVLVAPKAHREFAQKLEGLEMLRSAGVVERE